MSLKKETKEIQSKLASYCRTGEKQEIEGAKAGRLPQYRRLVFNVVNGALKQAYPITLSVLSEREWERLVNDFFSQHNPGNAQIWRMPCELFEFVSETNYGEKINRPYLEELLLFEWMEIELHAREDLKLPGYKDQAPLNTNEKPFLNPYHEILSLRYPVHLKAWKELENHIGNYFVLVYRNIETMRVHYSELSPFAAFLIEQLGQGSEPETAFSFASSSMNVEMDVIREKGLELLNHLYEQGIVLGIKA